MKDRVAPDVGAERHRHQIGRGAIRSRALGALAAAHRLPKQLKKPLTLRTAAFRIVVNQPGDFVEEAAAVRRRFDAERAGERLRSARNRHVLDGHGGRSEARRKGCDERGEEQTGQPP